MKIKFNQEIKQRIDKFLSEELKISRNKVQKLIKSGNVLVNKEEVTSHYSLLTGDQVEINNSELKESTKIKKFKANKNIDLDVIYEDDNYMVIDKPSGILVHPTEQMEDESIAAGLIAKYPKVKKVGEDPVRPGIVHRLDKNVSGLLLVVKNQDAFEYYKDLFKSRNITKIYTVLVHDKVEQLTGEITLNISRSKTRGRMAAHPAGSEIGKEARTEYEVVKQFKNLSLLKVQIHTGRTHQIRAHFNAIGHPVVGDPLYKQKLVMQKLNISRPFLHATKLSFIDQDGNEVSYVSKLPKELEDIINKID